MFCMQENFPHYLSQTTLLLWNSLPACQCLQAEEKSFRYVFDQLNRFSPL